MDLQNCTQSCTQHVIPRRGLRVKLKPETSNKTPQEGWGGCLLQCQLTPPPEWWDLPKHPFYTTDCETGFFKVCRPVLCDLGLGVFRILLCLSTFSSGLLVKTTARACFCKWQRLNVFWLNEAFWSKELEHWIYLAHETLSWVNWYVMMMSQEKGGKIEWKKKMMKLRNMS